MKIDDIDLYLLKGEVNMITMSAYVFGCFLSIFLCSIYFLFVIRDVIYFVFIIIGLLGVIIARGGIKESSANIKDLEVLKKYGTENIRKMLQRGKME